MIKYLSLLVLVNYSLRAMQPNESVPQVTIEEIQAFNSFFQQLRHKSLRMEETSEEIYFNDYQNPQKKHSCNFSKIQGTTKDILESFTAYIIQHKKPPFFRDVLSIIEHSQLDHAQKKKALDKLFHHLTQMHNMFYEEKKLQLHMEYCLEYFEKNKALKDALLNKKFSYFKRCYDQTKADNCTIAQIIQEAYKQAFENLDKQEKCETITLFQPIHFKVANELAALQQIKFMEAVKDLSFQLYQSKKNENLPIISFNLEDQTHNFMNLALAAETFLDIQNIIKEVHNKSLYVENEKRVDTTTRYILIGKEQLLKHLPPVQKNMPFKILVKLPLEYEYFIACKRSYPYFFPEQCFIKEKEQRMVFNRALVGQDVETLKTFIPVNMIEEENNLQK